MTLIWKHKYQAKKKQNLLMKFRLKKKSNFNNDLLTFLMPKFILSRIKFNLNETFLADSIGKIVVMFVYICNFDSLTNEFKDNIIKLLDNIFKDFDIMCEKYDV